MLRISDSGLEQKLPGRELVAVLEIRTAKAFLPGIERRVRLPLSACQAKILYRKGENRSGVLTRLDWCDHVWKHLPVARFVLSQLLSSHIIYADSRLEEAKAKVDPLPRQCLGARGSLFDEALALASLHAIKNRQPVVFAKVS